MPSVWEALGFTDDLGNWTGLGMDAVWYIYIYVAQDVVFNASSEKKKKGNLCLHQMHALQREPVGSVWTPNIHRIWQGKPGEHSFLQDCKNTINVLYPLLFQMLCAAPWISKHTGWFGEIKMFIIAWWNTINVVINVGWSYHPALYFNCMWLNDTGLCVKH